MGQAERPTCSHCGAQFILALPPSGKGPQKAGIITYSRGHIHIADLEQLGTVEVEKDRTIISVVGEGLRNTPGIAARVFSVISDINVSMISVGASSVNLTFMVDEAHAAEAIERLHRVCFEEQSVVGNVVEEILA